MLISYVDGHACSSTDLVVPLRGGDDGGTKPLDATYAQAANHGAYRDVPQHTLLAVFRGEEEYYDQRGNDENASKDQKAGSKEELLEFRYRRNGLFLGAVERNNHRAYDSCVQQTGISMPFGAR